MVENKNPSQSRTPPHPNPDLMRVNCVILTSATNK